ncbi:hypothetical protein CBS147332_8596 [Penicillium roqueforti]|nr:hypothetical protein CBS147332_8596 [Penicillium roqueforti]KAI3110902.1 hypothetical protein CBS147331_4878 [Penicillium roqueforti]
MEASILTPTHSIFSLAAINPATQAILTCLRGPKPATKTRTMKPTTTAGIPPTLASHTYAQGPRKFILRTTFLAPLKAASLALSRATLNSRTPTQVLFHGISHMPIPALRSVKSHILPSGMTRNPSPMLASRWGSCY